MLARFVRLDVCDERVELLSLNLGGGRHWDGRGCRSWPPPIGCAELRQRLKEGAQVTVENQGLSAHLSGRQLLFADQLVKGIAREVQTNEGLGHRIGGWRHR